MRFGRMKLILSANNVKVKIRSQKVSIWSHEFMRRMLTRLELKYRWPWPFDVRTIQIVWPQVKVSLKQSFLHFSSQCSMISSQDCPDLKPSQNLVVCPADMCHSRKSGSKIHGILRRNESSRSNIYGIPQQYHLVEIQDRHDPTRKKVQVSPGYRGKNKIKTRDLQDPTMKQKIRIQYLQGLATEQT